MLPAIFRTPAHPLRRAARTGFLTAAALLACATGAMAQTFYVDNLHPAASDAGPGTEVQPYRTMLAAATAHKGAGITILVKPGVYREQVSVPASGAAGSPFVFRATGPGVVMDGSDDLRGTAGWVLSSGAEYRCAGVVWTPKQVFVDANRLTAYPPESRGSLPANSFCYVAGEGLYVNLGGVNPGSRNISASRRNHAFTMSSRSFVMLDGFTITRTNDRGINMNTCADGVIANNRVSFTASYGVQAVNCQRMRIEGNVTTDAAMHGIGLTAGSTACTVRNNESARNAHPTTRMANGIYLYGAPGNTLSGNNLHHNQDTGMHFSSGSNDCVSFNNRAWANGDHGYDHLAAVNVSHVHDVSYGNYLDGFSFEGNSPGGRVHNCISVDNGLVAGGHDLWVDDASFVGFASDYNVVWNSTIQPIVRIGSTTHATLATHQSASGQDLHSYQANPVFTSPGMGDFSLGAGSPAIDAANSGVANWPATDAQGSARLDDTHEVNAGAGPVAYADIGPFERYSLDLPPVVVSPGKLTVTRGNSISFKVTASDPDGDAIQFLVMDRYQLPTGANVTFVTAADKKSGTFTWITSLLMSTGTYSVRFRGGNGLVDTSITQIQVKRRFGAEEISGPDDALAGPLALSDGYPNPSPGAVEFSLTLPAESEVEWGVFDMQGRMVFSESRAESPGRVQLRWSGRSTDGKPAPAGMYFARVRVGGTQFLRRVVRF